jgi:hypothetical protein
MLETPRAVFALWPSLEAVSDDFKAAGHDISASAVSKWAQRGRIGPEYWLPLVSIAATRGFEAVTFEALASMHARQPAEARA